MVGDYVGIRSNHRIRIWRRSAILWTRSWRTY